MKQFKNIKIPKNNLDDQATSSNIMDKQMPTRMIIYIAHMSCHFQKERANFCFKQFRDKSQVEGDF